MLELLVFLGEFFLEVLWQVVIEIALEFGLAGFKAAFDRPSRSLRLAMLGLFLLGVGVGGLSLLVWPERFFKPGPIPGVSLILSPICAGLALQAWGGYRRTAGHVTTSLATFPGGAALAAGTALVRFLCAR